MSETMSVYECPTCGVRHGIPAILERRALENRGPSGRRIYCPNGHDWFFTGKTDAERLRDQLERERAEATRRQQLAESRLQAERNAAQRAEARRRAAQGVITKLRKKGAQ